MSLLDRFKKQVAHGRGPGTTQTQGGSTAPATHGGAAPPPPASANQLTDVEEKILQKARTRVYNLVSSGNTGAKRPPNEPEKDYYTRIGRDCIQQVQDELKSRISAHASQKILSELLDGIVGFGKLQRLLEDDTISELMVNGPKKIYCERKGKVVLSDTTFRDNDEVMQVIYKIIAPLGRRCDQGSPMVDARLPDGSRVNVVIPPLALNGPTLSIRKFSKKPLSIADLVRFGAMTQSMADFLKACVLARLNIVVAGGTGSGKTTTLNVISGFIPEDERIVTIEDSAELRLQQDHVVSLETRPPNIEGKGAVTIRDLVKNSLRMRPERIVVGECRGGETLDMLQAMNTGHDGSLTTAHANTPTDAIRRVETMVMMAGMDLPIRNIREQIASAVDIIIQQTRLHDGSRKITSITEVDGMEGDTVVMREIFAWRQEGYDENGKVLGKLVATGEIPSFLHKFEEEGIELPADVFGAEIHLPTLISELNKRRAAEEAVYKAKLRAILEAQIKAEAEEIPEANEVKGTLLKWSDCVSPPAISPLMARRMAAMKKGGGKDDDDTPLSEEDRLAQQVMQQIASNESFDKNVQRMTPEEGRAFAKQQAAYLLDLVLSSTNKAITQVKRNEVIQRVVDDVLGLGPIQALLEDPGVAEVMVNGPDQIFIEKGGKLIRVEQKFRDDLHARQIINRIVSPLGRRCDDTSPMVDARLKDGSRVNAIIAPSSLIGPVITIRKFSKKPLAIPDLIRFGAMSQLMADFLKACVEVRLNVVVSGGTGSGKTTTLNALSSLIPDGERIVTIEDAAELKLQQTHVVSLESRPPNQEGKGAVPIRELVRNSLRMRPDRIVVGECRGGESLDMLQAMNTGKDGSMTTGHANQPSDMVARLETMVMMAGLNIPIKNIREQIASGVHLIVQQSRLKDGSRRLTSITEVAGMTEDGAVNLRDIFRFKQLGLDANGKVVGKLEPTGEVPGFLYKLREARIQLPEDVFGPKYRYSELIAEDGRMRAQKEREEEARNRALTAGQVFDDAVPEGKKAFNFRDMLPQVVEEPQYTSAMSRLRGGLGHTHAPGQAGPKDTGAERNMLDTLREKVMRLMTEDQDMQQRIKMSLSKKGDESTVLLPLVQEAVERENNLLRAGLPSPVKNQLVQLVMNDCSGFGPIQPLLNRDDISEVMVNGPKKVYYEHKGKLILSDVQFRDDAHVMHIISKIVTPLGRRCDMTSPVVDARLPDGSRVNAIIPPLALNGPTLTIRKFSKKKLSVNDMVKFNSLTPGMAIFMEACVKLALNIVVSGGTGSGKTTTLNALSGFIPEDERIVTVEDSAELKLQQDHVVSLETRPANIEGKGQITIRDLIKNCLRMRPDRVVVGECRSGETLDMLQAMNTGHEGSLTTAHANTPVEMMGRMEVMVLMAGTALPSRAIREQIASAVDLVIQQNRFHDGSRRITHITAVTGIEDESVKLEDIFLYQQTGMDENHKIIGHHVYTGARPSFLMRFKKEGIPLPDDVFGPEYSFDRICEEMEAYRKAHPEEDEH